MAGPLLPLAISTIKGMVTRKAGQHIIKDVSKAVMKNKPKSSTIYQNKAMDAATYAPVAKIGGGSATIGEAARVATAGVGGYFAGKHYSKKEAGPKKASKPMPKIYKT